MSCKKMTALCSYPLFMEGRIENPREKQDRLETGKTVSWEWSHRTALQSFLVTAPQKGLAPEVSLGFWKKQVTCVHLCDTRHPFLQYMYNKERYICSRIVLINPVMTDYSKINILIVGRNY